MLDDHGPNFNKCGKFITDLKEFAFSRDTERFLRSLKPSA